MRKLLILFIITSIILSGIYADDTNNSLPSSAMKIQYIDVDLSIQIPIYFSNYTSSDEFTYRTAVFQDYPNQKANIESYYFDADGQKVLGEIVSENDNKYVRFKIKPIKKQQYVFYVSGNIISESDYTLTNSIGNFSDFPEDLREYTESTKFIQSDFSEIRTVAKFLKNSDDPLENLVYVNNWVHAYLDYDLNYVSMVNDSISVLADRKGVCDEFAILEAAILRAQGYPVKYVVGYANTSQEWGAHAWLDVYVPGQGWIAVDPTYNEVGNIDATHLIVEKLKDPGESKDSVTYTNDVSVTFGKKEQTFNYKDIRTFEEQGRGNDLNLSMVFAKDAFQGSPHTTKLELKNTSTNPIVVLVTSQIAKDFIQLKPQSKKIVYYIKPNETKTADYYFKMPELENSYIYEFGFSSQFIDKMDEINIYHDKGGYQELFFSYDPIIYYKNQKFVFENKFFNYTNEDKTVHFEFDYNSEKSFDTLEVSKYTGITYTKTFPKIENASFSYILKGDYASSKAIEILSTIEKEPQFDDNVPVLTDEDQNKLKLFDNIQEQRLQKKSNTNYLMIGLVTAFVLFIVILFISKSIKREPQF